MLPFWSLGQASCGLPHDLSLFPQVKEFREEDSVGDIMSHAFGKSGSLETSVITSFTVDK